MGDGEFGHHRRHWRNLAPGITSGPHGCFAGGCVNQAEPGGSGLLSGAGPWSKSAAGCDRLLLLSPGPKPYKFIRFGAMDFTKPCNFTRFGATDATKPYKFIGFGAMYVTKPYKFVSMIWGHARSALAAFTRPCMSPGQDRPWGGAGTLPPGMSCLPRPATLVAVVRNSKTNK